MKWKCRDGRVLEVGEMDSGHIANTLHMLQRLQRIRLFQESLDVLAYACSGSTPDGAAMAAESEADRAMTHALDPEACFDALLMSRPVAREMYETLKNRCIPFDVTKWSES